MNFINTSSQFEQPRVRSDGMKSVNFWIEENTTQYYRLQNSPPCNYLLRTWETLLMRQWTSLSRSSDRLQNTDAHWMHTRGTKQNTENHSKLFLEPFHERILLFILYSVAARHESLLFIFFAWHPFLDWITLWSIDTSTHTKGSYRQKAGALQNNRQTVNCTHLFDNPANKRVQTLSHDQTEKPNASNGQESIAWSVKIVEIKPKRDAR